MKKFILLFTATTLLLGLCACGDKNEDGSPDETSVTESLSETIADTVSELTEQCTTADWETSSDLVVVEETHTEYGLIQIPQIDEKLLDGEDVRLANDMFESIRDRVLEGIKDCKKEWGDKPYHNASEPLCVTRYTKKGNLLSVSVNYTELTPYSNITKNNVAVNLDVSTVKALDHHEVIKSAGFTEDEVRAALRLYAERFRFYKWEHQVFNVCASEGTIPEGLGDPSYEWQEDLDILAAHYDTPLPSQSKPWDKLPHYPAVYVGDDGLEVCLSVPPAVGWDHYNKMVRIGHNDAETRLYNPDAPSGMPFERGAMLLDVAYEAVIQGFNPECTISADSMSIMTANEQSEPAYVFRAYTDEGDHIATVGWYGVGAFSGNLWEMDIISGKWVQMMNGTGNIPEEIYTGSHTNGALAAIWNEPDDYECWVANPSTEVDLIACGSDSNHYISDCDTLVIFAVKDDTLVSFENGTMKGDAFASQSQLQSLTLDGGESVMVYLDRHETPTQAITVSTSNDFGTYVVKRYDSDHVQKFEYIISDSTAHRQE